MRFGRKVRPIADIEQQPQMKVNSNSDSRKLPRTPVLCPDFLIETYLDYQVRCSVFCHLFTHSHVRSFFSTGRAILSQIRCEFFDLHIQSDGFIRPHIIVPVLTQPQSTTTPTFCTSFTPISVFTSTIPLPQLLPLTPIPFKISPTTTQSPSSSLRIGRRPHASLEYPHTHPWCPKRYLVPCRATTRGRGCTAHGGEPDGELL